ncbi:glycosyltransferase family 4 protein [Salinimicrobium tongyeongense]|uniref:Glycosyltransferase family 4 protein n=2 Tax=Salinimicrobium tongyeongense TaxID=2809707 RepID=A0ABY6NUZ7_9FLAO|nr:glycosyltransferase family 4 protein [Salinimicrobium tongyeongense]
MLSVLSHHCFNWALQLKDSGHEVYWMDVYDSNTYIQKIDFATQIVSWKNRVEIPGKYYLRKHLPGLNYLMDKINNRKFLDVFETKLQEIKPDVVQSFEMHSACIPILSVMKKNPEITWVYSSWGNDLYFFQRDSAKKEAMQNVLHHVDYMFADCTRDFHLAKKLGFKGDYLGTYPTGGGYDLKEHSSNIFAHKSKSTILIKGYQHRFGRAKKILEALLLIKKVVENNKVIVFGANEEIQSFVDSEMSDWNNVRVLSAIGRDEVMKLMGESIIYIGNSISDGMPNTLLEAIIMEAFPIQSNPGGATSELIQHGKNGFLIENPLNENEIAGHIKVALQDKNIIRKGIEFNTIYLKPKLERDYVQKQVLESYSLIEQQLTEKSGSL